MAIENTTGSNEFATIYTRDSLANDSCQEYDCPQSRVFKIIVIGDSNVGKTCLTYRFCGRKFLENPEATIGVDFRERTLQLDGEYIKVRTRTVEFISQTLNNKYLHSSPQWIHYVLLLTVMKSTQWCTNTILNSF